MKNQIQLDSIFFQKGIFSLMLWSHIAMWSQVGIQSDFPQGVLDISSTNSGVIYPTVSLVDINTETINNPNASNIVAGTIVFNTTFSGTGDGTVYPGLYFWDGLQWIPQFDKKDNKLCIQDSSRRVRSTAGDQAVSLDITSFTPKFTGKYRIVVTAHYGAGEVNSPLSPQFTNFISEEGLFKFYINGNTTSFTIKAFSGKNNDRLFKGGASSPQKDYVDQFNQTSYTIEDSLIAETPYSFSLTFNQEDAPGFISNGDSGNGRGYISISNNLKCTVEFNYAGN